MDVPQVGKYSAYTEQSTKTLIKTLTKEETIT